jgi:twitching motility protein PilT
VSLLDSLLDAIVRLDGQALIMHAGEKPYVVLSSASKSTFRGPLSWGQVELSSRPLTTDALLGMLSQMLSMDQSRMLDELGAIEQEIAAPGQSDERFIVTAARGGDDVWVEVGRRPTPATPAAVAPGKPVVVAPVAESAQRVDAVPEPGRIEPAIEASREGGPPGSHSTEVERPLRLEVEEDQTSPVHRTSSRPAPPAVSAEDREGELEALFEIATPVAYVQSAAERVDTDEIGTEAAAAFEISESPGSMQDADLMGQAGVRDVGAEAALAAEKAAFAARQVRAAEAEAALVAREAALASEAQAVLAAREAALAVEAQVTLAARESALAAEAERALAARVASLAAEAESALAAKTATLAAAADASLAAREAALASQAQTALTAKEHALAAEAGTMVAAKMAALAAEAEAALAARETALASEAQVALVAKEAALAAEAETVLAAKIEALAAEAEAALAERATALASEARAALAAKENALAAEAETVLAAKIAALAGHAEATLAARETALASETHTALAAKEAALTADAETALAAKEAALTADAETALAAKEAALAADAETALAAKFAALAGTAQAALAEREAAVAAQVEATLAAKEAALAADSQTALGAKKAALAADLETALAAKEAALAADLEAALTAKIAALAGHAETALSAREAALAEEAEAALAAKIAALAGHAESALAAREAALAAESAAALAEKIAALAEEAETALGAKGAALAAEAETALAAKLVALAAAAQPAFGARAAPVDRPAQELTARPSDAASPAGFDSLVQADIEAAVDPAAATAPAVVLPLARPVLKLQPPAPPPEAPAASTEASLVELLRAAMAHRASTLYAVVDTRPMMRVEGQIALVGTQAPIVAGDVERFIFEFAEREQVAHAAPEWTCTVPGVGLVRCVTFHDHSGAGLIFHLPTSDSSSADDLGLGPEVQALCREADGLVVVAGSRSSGKSTLLNAFVDLINRTRYDHVITIESRIRVVHEKRHSFISQREVRGDGDAIAEAARAALREGPDVLVIEDLRAPEALVAALDAARAGRLVFGSISAQTAPLAVERLIDAFPAERRPQVRASLAGALRAVVAQVLVPRAAGGRIAAREVLLSSPAVRKLILHGATWQLPIAIEGGRSLGMQTMVDSLGALVRDGIVEIGEACGCAPDRAGLIAALQRDGVDVSNVERRA